MFACRLVAVLAAVLISGCHPPLENDTTDSQQIRQQDPRPNIIVIFTDDQGYADLGANNATSDIRTPQIDTLAQNGVRMTNGYVTAPQCSPSRAALMTGMYQQRFGLDENTLGPMSLAVPTVADHFKNVGYHTGMVGKWHLEARPASEAWIADHQNQAEDSDPLSDVTLAEPYHPWNRGFDECFSGSLQQFWATFDPDTGDTFPVKQVINRDYRIDLIHRAARSFIARNANKPFFLYVAPFAPHTPLDATDEYLAEFPQDMPLRRRYALAMLAAVDNGVGQIVATLKSQGIYENTMIIFMSDNGAPLGLDMDDVPIEDNTGVWNGSLNTPMTGEKGMLTEGGIRIPYVLHWPAKITGKNIISEPVSSLDAIYTALKVAGVSEDVLATLDGQYLMPAVLRNSAYLRNRPLYWRFANESAVRLGNWKYLRTSDTNAYLFEMTTPELATNNVISLYPDIAASLNTLLEEWDATLQNPANKSPEESDYYNYHLNPD